MEFSLRVESGQGGKVLIDEKRTMCDVWGRGELRTFDITYGQAGKCTLKVVRHEKFIVCEMLVSTFVIFNEVLKNDMENDDFFACNINTTLPFVGCVKANISWEPSAGGQDATGHEDDSSYVFPRLENVKSPNNCPQWDWERILNTYGSFICGSTPAMRYSVTKDIEWLQEIVQHNGWTLKTNGNLPLDELEGYTKFIGMHGEGGVKSGHHNTWARIILYKEVPIFVSLYDTSISSPILISVVDKEKYIEAIENISKVLGINLDGVNTRVDMCDTTIDAAVNGLSSRSS